MARRYFVVEEDRGLGCCNLVIWDFLLVAFLAGYSVSTAFGLHMVFCIVIGVAAGGLMLAFMGMKGIGKVFQLICSLFWAYVCWEILKDMGIIGETILNDKIWNWAIRIALFIIFAAIHFASAKEIIGDKDNNVPVSWYADAGGSSAAEHDSLQRRYDNLVDAYNQSGEERDDVMEQASKLVHAGKGGSRLNTLMQENDTLWQEGAARMPVYVQMLGEAETANEQRSLLDKAEELLKRMQKSTKEVTAEVHRILLEEENAPVKDENSVIEESLFAGCNSKESLQKRYKSLMKTFHPDNADGDETMAVKISATYEELLKRYN